MIIEKSSLVCISAGQVTTNMAAVEMFWIKSTCVCLFVATVSANEKKVGFSTSKTRMKQQRRNFYLDYSRTDARVIWTHMAETSVELQRERKWLDLADLSTMRQYNMSGILLCCWTCITLSHWSVCVCVMVNQLLLVITDLWLMISVADLHTESWSFLGSVWELRVMSCVPSGSSLHNPHKHMQSWWWSVSLFAPSLLSYSPEALPSLQSSLIILGTKLCFVLWSGSFRKPLC